MTYRAIIQCSGRALCGAAVVVLLVASSAMADSLMTTVVRDGLIGRLEHLEATRARLEERAQAGSKTAASLRYDRAFVAWWIARAIELAPDNPRACLQRAKIILYAPAMVGGGADHAIKLLEHAQAVLAQADDRWPSWGLLDVLAWYGRALAHGGRVDEAREVYQQVLEIEPEARWIRVELVPELGPAP